MTGFLSIFAQSPFKPIQEHMSLVQDCVQELLPFIDSSHKNNWEEALENRNKISFIEGKADDLKYKIILQLPKSIFLPVSRHDLIDLVDAQDRIANKAKDFAGTMLGRKINIPDTLFPRFKEYTQSAIEATEQTYKVISELDELLAAGFSGHEVKVVKNMIADLDRIEKNNDRLQVDIRTDLFSLEEQLPPIDVIFLYKLIDLIGDLADRAQQTGHKLLLLLAK